MRLADETLAGIVARASTFRERLSNGTLIPVDGNPDTVADRRLQQWRSKAARGDQRLFEEILGMQNLDVETARRALGPVRLADCAALPDWAEWLNDALAMAGIVPDEHETPPRCIHPDEPLPYGRLLAPFVSAAAARLQARVPRIHDLLPDPAQASNERTLLRLLHGICRSALDMEFAVFRIGREDSPLSAQLQPPAADELAAFTQHMRRGGLLKFCTEYAVLARAVPLIMRNWADATSDFLDRLEADRRQIEAEFLSGKPLGAVATLEAGLSDPHNDCRMVMALSFDTGLKLLYKPKNLETEVAYSRLLEWLNGRGLSLPLKLTKVLPRDGYGWVEFIRHEDCGTDAELQRFYRRCGMLLALFQALGATDVHAENLIAHGEHPVMIDAETLITPHLDDREELDQAEYGTWAEVRAGRMVRRSVVRVGMLPWNRMAEGVSADPSGLGAHVGWDASLPVASMAIGSTNHLPFPDPARRDIAAFTDNVVAGFREVYSILLDGREALLTVGSPLRQLAGSAMRLIFRDTQTYFSLLHGSLEARLVRDGADRSVELESLTWLLGISKPRDRYLPFIDAERRAIERIDIPVFAVAPLTRDLHTGPGEITPDYLARPCFEFVRETLEQMGPADLAEQEGRIRYAFAAKRATMMHRGMIATDATDCLQPAAAWDGQNARAAAAAIGRDFQSRAVWGDDGSAVWDGAVWEPAYRLMECGVAPARYCEGLGDVVLFTAASGAADLAQGAARTLRRTMDMINGRPGKRNSQTIDLRFATLVYPLARAAALALIPELNEGAKVALGFITPATLAADKHLDIVQGTAGFLLGALAMHEIDASAGGLEKAIECGNHLLARRSNWPCYEGAPALGLAFGLAGVILALARLAHITGQERFLDAAKAAFRFEWKQRQQAPGDPGWAEGQTGFGYACLAMLPHLGAEAQDALEAAIQTAATSTDVALDSLYSGIFGRVDFLIEAASACGRSDLLDRARAMAAWSIDRASRRGGFALIPGAAAGMWAPGICYGAAGIGYTLLRLLDPCTVPSLVARG